MNEAYLIPLLKDYVTYEGAEQIDKILDELSEATGFPRELVSRRYSLSIPALARRCNSGIEARKYYTLYSHTSTFLGDINND